MPALTGIPDVPTLELAESLVREFANWEPGDDEATAVERLALLPGLISEVVFSDEDSQAISAALSEGDLAEVGRLFVVARDRYVVELIERRREMYHDTLDDDEAAKRLCEVYS